MPRVGGLPPIARAGGGVRARRALIVVVVGALVVEPGAMVIGRAVVARVVVVMAGRQADGAEQSQQSKRDFVHVE